ncbi:MAG TPA: glycogen/starch/alpha-glucan family phosphorylase [Chlamydiales bacterium]|nr:glycogen/starch/alpha-glucan family phosphorylase [Chlamydiales bacterium]
MDDTNEAEEILAQKIRHLIITSSGKTCDEATTEEFYQAFCTALHEEVMINWTAANHTFEHGKVRMAFLLSMEYLPGRLLNHNISNLGADKLVQGVLTKLHRSLNQLLCCESEAGLGNGGLGRLSSCFLDSLATLRYPARGYGLRYQYGIFEQEVWDGMQVEKPDPWLLNANPWEQRRDTHCFNVHFKGRPFLVNNKNGEEVELLEDYEEVRALPFEMPIIGYNESSDYSVISLRLWSTKESPRNFQLQRFNAGFFEQAAENVSLTDVLYPNDDNEMGKRIRLKQEFLLVSASLQDILQRTLRIFGNLSVLSDKVRIQINDTHPALMIAELIRILIKDYDFSWKDARDTCQACCSYTNHTILKESLEEWREKRVEELLPRQFRVIQKLNQELCDAARSRFPNDEERIKRISIIENGQIRMAHLAIFGSHKINGVAKLHTQILKKKIFPDFADLYPEKFTSITNGIAQRRWLLNANPLLAAFISKRIGKSWITNFAQIKNLEKFASDPKSQEEFLQIKKKNKEKLIEFLTQKNPLRDRLGKVISHSPNLSTDALFDVHIKRFHEYKRQLLNALHLIMVYQELLQEPSSRKVARFAIFSGKAAPGYKMAKQILDLVYALGRSFSQNETIQSRLAVAFIENYNVSKAELIIPAADLSEQISAAGWEASGTGNMKLAINGALTIGSEDGSNIEMHHAITDRWWPFQFGSGMEENQRPYNPKEIYQKDLPIRKAVDTLKHGTFADSQREKKSFGKLFEYLISSDPFRVLKDLRSYYETQKKAEELFLQPMSWAETAIQNISKMGSFSSDVSIQHYAKEIWNIEPCPLNAAILQKVRQEYFENDRCRIVNH